MTSAIDAKYPTTTPADDVFERMAGKPGVLSINLARENASGEEVRIVQIKIRETVKIAIPPIATAIKTRAPRGKPYR